MPNTLLVAKLITVIRWHHFRMKKITTINIHPGDSRQSRFRSAGTGTAFFVRTSLEKRFFFVTAPAKKQLGKKKTGWNRGTFWRKKYQKPHARYSKFSAKVTSWKYRVTKGGTPGNLRRDHGAPPVGFIQIGKSIWPEPLFQNFHSGSCLQQKFF